MLKVGTNTISKIQGVLLTLLVIYAGYLVAGLVWHLIGDDETARLSLPATKTQVAKKVSGREATLARYHLFGEVGRAPAKKKSDAPKVAPKTSLRLVLKGVFTSEQASASGAIVEEIGKKADYYGVGDKLPGNAILEEVYHDRILLRRNGRLETLAFAEKKQGKNNIAKVPPKSKPKPARPATAQVDTPEQFMSEAVNRIAENPEQALGSVGLKASDSGYVYQGGNPMLAGLNLKKGDVIRSVNGHNLGDIQRDKELMKSLYEQGSLEVEIMRDGASFYVNYPLR